MRDAVVVLGSCNYDFILSMPHLPQRGESLIATGLSQGAGGKGANQAVQLAKLGVPTFMAGRVGRDAFGEELRGSLERYGVDISHLARCHEPTGMALIEGDPQGEVTCAVVKGANFAVSLNDVEALQGMLSRAAWLVLQMEIPQQVNCFAIERAKALGCQVLLNAAPAAPINEAMFGLVDFLVVNEVEAAFYLKRAIKEPEAVLAGAQELSQRVAAPCVITLGELGSVFATQGAAPKRAGYIAALEVAAKETTGAGDSYVGGLVYALCQGADLERACLFATHCSALTVQRVGAQDAMPTLAEVEAILP